MAGSRCDWKERVNEPKVFIAEFVAAHRISLHAMYSNVPLYQVAYHHHPIVRQSLVLQRYLAHILLL